MEATKGAMDADGWTCMSVEDSNWGRCLAFSAVRRWGLPLVQSLAGRIRALRPHLSAAFAMLSVKARGGL
jgi:hypothetical protein